MTCTTNYQLALHKVLQIKRFHNLRNLYFLSFSFWLFIHHLRYTNIMTSCYDVILQEFGLLTSGKSKNPYMSYNLNSFQKQTTSVIKRKLSHIKLIVLFPLSRVRIIIFNYLLEFFFVSIFSFHPIKTQQNRDCIEKSTLDTIFGKTVLAKFCKVHTHYLQTGNITCFAVGLFTRIIIEWN